MVAIMNGKIELELWNKHVHYDLCFSRNISIIQGASGTGKTALCKFIDRANKPGGGGMHMRSNAKRVVSFPLADADNWQERLSTYQDSLIFFDEGLHFVHSEDFSRAICGTSNYYVIISRIPVKTLPYSVTSVYKLLAEKGTDNVLCVNNIIFPEADCN